MFKIFISYSQKDKEIAGDLKRYFEEYDQISCFIAHDDIAPGSQWEQEILDNLETSIFFSFKKAPLPFSAVKISFKAGK